jgi:stage II sporulation protein D
MRRIASATVAALLGALACAPVAPAASRLVITGHGYGHGIGMSQYGALGFAQHGVGYRDILDHYYAGTSVGNLGANPDVRVLLQSGRRVVVSGAVAADDKQLDPARTYSARASGGRIALYSPTGRRMATYDAPLRFASPSGGAVQLRGSAANGTRDGRYRGALEVGLSDRGVMAVNALDLEDYVRGVISAESPANWPADALKAQAVAARTYAVTTNVGTTTDGIDQYADTRSQMYKGVAAEFPPTDAAVDATRGEVVTQGGQPVTTYFFSTSGGHTENIEFSFIGALPRTWLQGVDDPYDAISPKHTWGPFSLTGGQAQSKLKGLVRGSFRGIKVLQRGSSPRIVRAEIAGTAGVTEVTGPQLRQRLGLNDTWATFTFISSSAKKPKDTTSPAPGGDGSASGGTSPDGAPVDSSGGQAAMVARVRPSVLTGSISRIRRGAAITLQRRDGRAWRALRQVRVGAQGRYSASVPGPGTYRVVWGNVAGPAVDMR